MYEDADEFCPNCTLPGLVSLQVPPTEYRSLCISQFPGDNQYVSRLSSSFALGPALTLYASPLWQVVEAKIPQAMLGVEGEDARINSRCVPLAPHSDTLPGALANYQRVSLSFQDDQGRPSCARGQEGSLRS